MSPHTAADPPAAFALRLAEPATRVMRILETEIGSLTRFDPLTTTREFRIVFFPWRVLTTLGVGGLTLGYLASLVFNNNVGYIVFLTMVAQYLVYETFHYCCHVHENWFVRNVPFINTIRRHHTAHHNMGIMMKYNMNLTFPIADWVMGTTDLRRGLLGHLFNGYSNKHVKEELKPIIAKFRHDHTRVTLDGPQLTSKEESVMVGAASPRTAAS